MNKSVYSLMIFDEIVDQLDEMASKNNLNRSQLINEILADYLGLMTPEQKIQQIFTFLSKNCSNSLTVAGLNSNSSIRFIKNLDYKYHPKITFTYEFTGSGDQKFAVLKISSRTKSAKLNQLFEKFFEKIVDLEHKNSFYFGRGPDYESNHKFVREFKYEGSVKRNIEELAKFLLNYLLMVDEAMDIYFSKSQNNIDEKLQNLFDQFFESNRLQIISDHPTDLVCFDSVN